MGYESRLFIMNRTTWENTDKTVYHYAQELARINMCVMGYDNGFIELFTMPVDFEIYGDNDADLTTDKYGDHVKYADFDTVIAWLEEIIKTDNYRRLKPLLAYLKAFDKTQWEDLIVVHYGY